MPVTVDTRGAFRKLNKLRSIITDRSRLTVKTLTKKGVSYAQSIAPYDTGRQAQAIKAKSDQITPTTVSWRIIAPEVHPTNLPTGLVGYMHSNRPGAEDHFRKDRDRKFMFTTRKWLNQVKKGVAQGGFRNIRIS